MRKLKQIQPKKRLKLLDVGAAHGWFLDAAVDDFDVLGIEPDEVIFEATSSQGKPIRLGYFPNALLAQETFDVITFNDVIEHLPNINAVLLACYERLNENGYLLVNLPNSRGFFYRVAKLLHSFNIKTPFERLWQKGMPSPHVHYFNPKNLIKLVNSHGFSEVTRGTLPSLKLNGLFTRISYTGEYNFFAIILVCFFTMTALPILKFLPKDITFIIFRRIQKK